jgi:RNase P/RNase MRP subunit p30
MMKVLCSTTDVDLISLDRMRYQPKHCWKELKSAVNRDVAIELFYLHFLGSDSQVKQFISCAQNVVHATRVRNAKMRKLFLSFGSDVPDWIRSPSNVRNIAQLLGFPSLDQVTSTVPKAVIAKGLARQAHADVARRLRAQPDTGDNHLIKIVVDDPPIKRKPCSDAPRDVGANE